MTRIVAGRLGGRRLAVPPDGTRPTAERAREALFSSLESMLGIPGERALDGVRFLDLYAGSGAVGIEAASRGAAEVVLVESAPKALRVLRSNVTSASRDLPWAQLTVVGAAVDGAIRDLAIGAATSRAFDVVFADPPYDLAGATVRKTLASLIDGALLAPGATVVVERSSREEWSWPPGIEAVRQRRYGDAQFWYGRAARTVSD